MKFKQFVENLELPKSRKVLWSGIQLDGNEREKLNIGIQMYLEPLLAAGWQQQNRPPPGVPPEILPDHMTIIAMKELPPEMKSLLGTKQQMIAYAFGENGKAAAVKVRSNVKSFNANPHITVAISPTGKPFESNTIENWVPLEQEIVLFGIVVEKVAGK